MIPLTRTEWDRLRQRWREREGSADWSLGSPLRDQDWHDARAHDAEQTGQPFTARRHLDHLIKQKPNDWLLCTRRARTYAEEGKWQLAEADYQQALERSGQDEVLAWYWHQAWSCQSRQQWAAALWYLDRLLRARPEEQALQEQRAEVQAKLGKAKR